MGEVFRALAKQKECEVLEGPLKPDHVQMLISIPPNQEQEDRRQEQLRLP